MTFMNLTRTQRSFISNWKLSEKINTSILKSKEYLFPHLFFTFNLWDSPHNKISPVMGDSSLLEQPGQFEIKINFSSEETVTGGVIVYHMIYEDSFVSIKLNSGEIENPLAAI